MTAPKPTPGPWVATPSSATIRARRTFHGAVNDYIIDNSVIANLPASSDRYANAHLIASAPEMLEALEKCYAFIASEYACAESQALQGEHVSAKARPVWNALCAAIAKAKGSSQ